MNRTKVQSIIIKREFYLCGVDKIYSRNENVRISCSDGVVTHRFKMPRQGLHLKKGDLIIRHGFLGNTMAIDKVVKIKGSLIQIKRILGSIKDVPSIKKQFVDLKVHCI